MWLRRTRCLLVRGTLGRGVLGSGAPLGLRSFGVLLASPSSSSVSVLLGDLVRVRVRVRVRVGVRARARVRVRVTWSLRSQ